ncbi:MAG: hypothetical protein DRP46_03640 [Candidatus Zixiibacteriota bacterium]|nr:MAG: hypothetical protein DRP46_03640 [candidate division Zixibacteria bacterium]
MHKYQTGLFFFHFFFDFFIFLFIFFIDIDRRKNIFGFYGVIAGMAFPLLIAEEIDFGKFDIEILFIVGLNFHCGLIRSVIS